MNAAITDHPVAGHPTRSLPPYATRHAHGLARLAPTLLVLLLGPTSLAAPTRQKPIPLTPGPFIAPAQLAAKPSRPSIPAEYDQSAARGPHHRRHVSVRTIQDEFGSSRTVTDVVVELETGMHYQEDGVWKESTEAIELFPAGAVARRGAHKVIFAPTLNTAGAIDLETPDGLRLRSHVLGLSYLDVATGESVFIAKLKDSSGVLVASNVVEYPDAFDTVEASVRYTYTKTGLEQDVVLLSQPTLKPEDYGLNPATTRLEVFTEFINPPQPIRRQLGRPVGTNSTGQVVVDAATADEWLSFGAMTIGRGTAFTTPEQTQAYPRRSPDVSGLPIQKSFEQLQGRDVLIESIPFPLAWPQLQQLPKPRGARAAIHPDPARPRATHGRTLPNPAPDRARAGTILRRGPSYARAQAPEFVLDYSITITSLTNFVFRQDTTYYVPNTVGLYGTTTIQGGTVVKFAPWVEGVAYPCLSFSGGNILCDTEPFHPAIFTSKDDDSVGAKIPGSSGVPSGLYAYAALSLNAMDYSDLRHLRFLRAQTAVHYQQGAGHSVSHCQILGGAKGFSPYGARLQLGNVLIQDNACPISTTPNTSVIAQNVSFVGFTSLCEPPTLTLIFTNCLMVGPGALRPFTGSHNASDPNLTALESLGGGGAYLPASSPYRDAGTTTLPPSLLADLKIRTTTAPGRLSGSVAQDTVLAPSVRPDNDTLDLGYHYPRIDWLVSNLVIQDASLTLTHGVHLATAGSRGFELRRNGRLLGQGAPDNPIRILRFSTVQEHAADSPDPAHALIFHHWTDLPEPQVKLSFADLRTVQAPFGAALLDAKYAAEATVEFRDCTLGPGLLNCLSDVPRVKLTLANCLLNGVTSTLKTFTATIQNCSFLGGGVEVNMPPAGSALIGDTLFDKTAITTYPNGTRTFGTNAYLAGYPQLSPSGGANVILTTSPVYQPGPYGRRYLPNNSPLLNAGSRSATAAGLYHYTTLADAGRELDSPVDIGFHSPATGGTPSDTVWVEDALPPGALSAADYESWNWTAANPTPVSGYLAHASQQVAGFHQHYFYDAGQTLSIAASNTLIAYIYLDPVHPPSTVMLQWYTTDSTGWNHRAFWGADTIHWVARTACGNLPPTGAWVRLEVPAEAVDLVGRTVSGMAYTLQGGAASWDKAGKCSLSQASSQVADLYVDDATPSGAVLAGDNEPWSWVSSHYSGALSHASARSPAFHQHYFHSAPNGLAIGPNDTLFTSVWLEAGNVPVELMMQWYAVDATGWEHRAYWGADLITGLGARTPMGNLPPSGGWVTLSVPASAVDLAGRTVTGWAYTLYGGRAYWDYSGRAYTAYVTTPSDSDQDSLADYAEDTNGNGQVDPGETSPSIPNSTVALAGAFELYTPLP